MVMSLWSIFDCNKWKYFDKLTKSEQVQCQIFCYQLLKYVFTQTPFLSVTSSIFTQYVKSFHSLFLFTRFCVILKHGMLFR